MATNDALYIIDASSRQRTSSLEAHPNRYSSFRSSPTSKSFPSVVINELKTLNNQSKKMNQMTNMVVITGQSQMKISIFSLMFCVITAGLYSTVQWNLVFSIVLGIIASLLILKFYKIHQDVMDSFINFFFE